VDVEGISRLGIFGRSKKEGSKIVYIFPLKGKTKLKFVAQTFPKSAQADGDSFLTPVSSVSSFARTSFEPFTVSKAVF
jgi:hypothetical protein